MKCFLCSSKWNRSALILSSIESSLWNRDTGCSKEVHQIWISSLVNSSFNCWGADNRLFIFVLNIDNWASIHIEAYDNQVRTRLGFSYKMARVRDIYYGCYYWSPQWCYFGLRRFRHIPIKFYRGINRKLCLLVSERLEAGSAQINPTSNQNLTT